MKVLSTHSSDLTESKIRLVAEETVKLKQESSISFADALEKAKELYGVE